MDVTGKFPIYEADQVLSAEHLNQSLAYLEKHDRLSRRLLHGVGIVCGLNFRVIEGTLLIDKGCGISSEGFLLALEEGLELTKVRKYIPPYPPKYTPFYQTKDNPFDLWEAVPATEAEGDGLQKLSAFNLKDKVLLLYLEAKDKDLKECIGDDCDNNGTVREFTLRPLIISLADLVKIFNQDGNTIEDIASDELARYTLNEILPPRFDVVATNIATAKEISETYSSMADTLLPELSLGLMQTEALYADSLKQPKAMADGIAKLKTKLATVKNADLGQQYFFDHLCDIAAAYNEFAEVATRWMVACMPDENDFPRHLALGEFAEIKEHYPKIFRNYFKHAPTAPEAHRQQKHVAFLYNRLLKVLQGFDLKNEKQIKTTRSNYGTSLSEKAIPYYYRPESSTDISWLLGWDFNRRERGIWKRVGHYFNKNQNLERDLEGNNFFRIEGQIGKPYTEALAEVKKQINTYRLPVKAIALSTGSVPLDLNLLDECRIADLDAQFDAARDSLFCQLQDVSCFFGSLSRVSRTSSAAKMAEASAAGARMSAPADAVDESEATHKFTADTSNISGIKSSLSRFTIVTGIRDSSFVKGQFIGTHCRLTASSIGRAYLELIQRDEIKGKSLLDLYLQYLNLGKSSPPARQTALLRSFPYFVLDEIEELVGILKASTLSTLNFRLLRDFSNEFIAFIKLYINEINRLENEDDFTIDPAIHDIKHQLIHLVGLCKLKAFYSIYQLYRERITTALEELRFNNFIKKHPGIDHKAGVPTGGTFILVYHTTIKARPDLTIEARNPDMMAVVESEALFEEVKKANPTVRMATMDTAKRGTKKVDVKEADSWMREKLKEYAEVTGGRITDALRKRFEELLSGFRDKQEQESNLAEGTVVADFYLPYICCSDCGGLEINITEPLIPVTISLPEKRYCLGSEKVDDFVVSPVGGEVTGPGVKKEKDKFSFNPAAADVALGTATFTYTFEGRTAQTQVHILERPEADFETFIDNSANGSFVRIQNNSQNATSYLWDFGNGTTSKAEKPETQFYSLDQEDTVITLTASNGACEDVESRPVKLITKSYELIIGKGTKDFCSDMGPQQVRISIINIGFETFPFDGEVKGKGVTAPDGQTQKQFTFDPSVAGTGNHTLVYNIGGEKVAEIELNVVKAFSASFEAKASSSSDGLTIAFKKIGPAKKQTYNWRFDEKQPLEVDSRTNNNDFSRFYTINEVRGRKEITVELRVNDFPCSAVVSETIAIPAISNEKRILTFDPDLVKDSFVIDTPVRRTSSPIVLSRLSTTSTTSPGTEGTKLLNDITSALKNSTNKKKLLSGAMNNALGKSFLEVISGLNKTFADNKKTMTAAQKTEFMTFYGKVSEAMINLIGMLDADLKASETLAKSFKSVGSNISAMVAMGMPTATKNGIKNRLTALAGLEKPVAAKLASTINSAL